MIGYLLTSYLTGVFAVASCSWFAGANKYQIAVMSLGWPVTIPYVGFSYLWGTSRW